MSHDQAKTEANKRREEERAAGYAAAAAQTNFAAPGVNSAAVVTAVLTRREFVANYGLIPVQSQPSSPSPEYVPTHNPAQGTSPISYALLPSGESNISEIYSAQTSVGLFAPPKKIVEQEQQEERILRYIIRGTMLSGIGAGLIIAGSLTLYCPPLAATLITVGVVLEAISLFYFAMAAAISLRTEKQNSKNGHELQNVFDKTFGEQQATPDHNVHVFA